MVIHETLCIQHKRSLNNRFMNYCNIACVVSWRNSYHVGHNYNSVSLGIYFLNANHKHVTFTLCV